MPPRGPRKHLLKTRDLRPRGMLCFKDAEAGGAAAGFEILIGLERLAALKILRRGGPEDEGRVADSVLGLLLPDIL